MAGLTFPAILPASWDTPQSLQFWSGQDRKIRGRLYVGRPDGYTWVDLTDFLIAARVNLGNIASIGTGSSGVDCVVRQATLTLHQKRPEVASLNPRDQASSWNLVGGVYTPLLWPNREIVFDLAACPIDREPYGNEWIRVFHGYMGDSIKASSADGKIPLLCRDQSKRLADVYIEAVRSYGSAAGVPAETVIQQIINDNLGAGEVTVYCPISPGFMITPYQVEYGSVWDAIQQVAAQIGWYLGYRYWPDLNDFRLTLMAPPRYKTAAQWDFDLSWLTNVRVQDLDITDHDVRNAVLVTYRDASTGQRASVTREDAASIAEYGRRAMQIEEADTSLIDTAAEAQALADAALWDLKDLTGISRITMPLMPTMDIFAGLLVTNPRLSSTQDFYAVQTVELNADWSDKDGKFQGSTEVVASGRVVGAHGKWLAMQTRPGAAGNPMQTGNIAPAAVVKDRIATATVLDGNLANLAAGTVANGTRVTLAWPEARVPKVNVSPTDLLTLDASRNTLDQKAKVYATTPIWDGSQWFFDVYGMLVIPGVSTNNGTIPGSSPTWTSGDSPASTTVLYVTIGVTASGSSPVEVVFAIDYKRSADSAWITAISSIGIVAGPGSSASKECEVKSGLSPDVYQVRVRLLSQQGSPGGPQNPTWRSLAEEVIYNGTIAWIATA